jgi:p-aminobenzoyl-glutamate transporter AbgT
MLLPWIVLFVILSFAIGGLVYGIIQRVQSAREHYEDWRAGQPR